MRLKKIWLAIGIASLAVSSPSSAQVFTILHTFTNTPDGAYPLRLTAAAGQLYGSTAYGGTNGSGTLYLYDTNRSVFNTFYSFTGDPDNGSSPNNVLVVADNVIYGTTIHGGDTDGSYGTIYSVGTDGTGFNQLYSFGGGPDGALPTSGLILRGATLYGTANNGGSATGNGTVFEINTNGSGFATLHVFTNSPDGSAPESELVEGDGILFGTTFSGGANTNGTIFAVNTNGTGYTVLYSFANVPDAVRPAGGLALDAGVLYGVCTGGGANTNGAIFAINTNGTGYRILYSFSGFDGNLDGDIPKATLTLSGGHLIGTTVSGGAGRGGTVFLVDTNGDGFAVLASFTNAAATGEDLLAGVIRVGNALWGTAYEGGGSNDGTLFELPLPAITSQPQSLIVTNEGAAVFAIQAADDSPVAYQWYFNTNTLLAGQTNNTLAIASANNTNSGTYTVVASDTLGAVTSSPAVLTVTALDALPPIIITTNPQSAVVTNGDPVTFTAAATGAGPLAFQWYFGTNTPVAGATNTSLTFTNVTTCMGGYYSMQATNASGSVTSSYALLVVSSQLNLLSFTLNPASGSAAFTLANAIDSSNLLWASTNLARNDWGIIASNVMDSTGLWFVTDTNAAQAYDLRFYRFSTP